MEEAKWGRGIRIFNVKVQWRSINIIILIISSLKNHGSQNDQLVRVSSKKRETFLNITSPLPKTHFPETVPLYQLKHVDPLVQTLFPKGEKGNFPLAGRLQYFSENWKILTNDPKILEWVSGLQRLPGGIISRKSSIPDLNVNARVRINQRKGRRKGQRGPFTQFPQRKVKF